MNNKRRVVLYKSRDLLNSAYDLLNKIYEEENESFYNLPDEFKNGKRGENAQRILSQLYDAIDFVECAIVSVNDSVK